MSVLVEAERLREHDPEKLYRWLQQIIGRDLGQTDWGSPINHVSFDSDSETAHTIRNLGTGGAFQVKSTADANLLLANESGVTIPTLIVTTISATTVNAGTVNTTDLSAIGNTTLGNNTAVDTVTINAAVTNNGALTSNGSTILGDSITLDTHAVNGQLTITADQPLKLKNSAGAGTFTLNPTNVGNPVLEFKDASGDNMLLIYPSASTYAIDVNLGTLATNAARFTGDVLITTDLGVNDINATGNVVGVAGTFSGAVSGTTGTFSGAVSGTTGTFTTHVAGGSSPATAGTFRMPAGGSFQGVGSGSANRVLVTIDSSNSLTFGNTSTTTFLAGSSVEIQSAATTLIKISGGNAIGLYGVTPVTRQDVSGSRGGAGIYTVVADLLQKLENVGIITDSTTA